jgi:hypothetical protein
LTKRESSINIKAYNSDWKTNIILKLCFYGEGKKVVILVVGADRLGNIHKQLNHEGAWEIIHWTGRCKSSTNKCIPKRVQKIIVFCDFINHPLMGSIKKQAKKGGIPVTYSKRALSHKAACN